LPILRNFYVSAEFFQTWYWRVIFQFKSRSAKFSDKAAGLLLESTDHFGSQQNSEKIFSPLSDEA